MNKSESIAKLALALSKAQGELRAALKDSKNPFFKSTYANLESVWEVCREVLPKNELAVVQTFDFAEGADFLETTLIHSSGEWISGRIRMIPKDQTAQGLGSAATYCRRYGLSAIVGVIQTDDDGEEANGRKNKDPDPREAFVDTLVKKAHDAQTLPELQKLWADNLTAMNALSDGQRERIQSAFSRRKGEVR